MRNMEQALTSTHLTNSCVFISLYSSKALVPNLVVIISPQFFLHFFDPCTFYHFRRHSKIHKSVYINSFCLFKWNSSCLLALDHADLLLHGNNFNILYFWKEPWVVIAESLLHITLLGYWIDSFLKCFYLFNFGLLHDLHK